MVFKKSTIEVCKYLHLPQQVPTMECENVIS